MPETDYMHMTELMHQNTNKNRELQVWTEMFYPVVTTKQQAMQPTIEPLKYAKLNTEFLNICYLNNLNKLFQIALYTAAKACKTPKYSMIK